ncbi:MAG TPA: hypothetical protein VID27_16660 [Blastocatellia bacterium]|jgi:hypothetical protein
MEIKIEDREVKGGMIGTVTAVVAIGMMMTDAGTVVAIGMMTGAGAVVATDANGFDGS